MTYLVDKIIDEDVQAEEILDDMFLRETHRMTFCNVWQWAGQYCTVELSIGVDPAQVSVQTRSL